MKLNPYLDFDGNCREAFEFYAACLNGEVVAMMTFEGTPAADYVSASHRDRIMHGCVRIGDQLLMGTDATPEQPYKGMGGCSIALHPDSLDEAERVFRDLSDGGQATMPLEKTFWAERYGMLTDRFGVAWMVNYSGEDCI